MCNLYWFKSDLRVYDNPALKAATNDGSTVAVYCLTESQWDMHDVSPAKRSLILRQLALLADSLAELNIPLRVLDCSTFMSVPAALSELACQLGVSKLFFNREYEFNEQQCEQQVACAMEQLSVQVRQFDDQCVVKPGALLTKQGDMYKVFSAFRRVYLAQFTALARKLENRPSVQADTGIESDLKVLDAMQYDTRFDALWPAGEDEAHDRLNSFIEQHGKRYKDERDFPALDATSGLSAYLATGILTTGQCMQAAISMNEGSLDGRYEGMNTWVNELIWRDFYRHLLAAFPRLSKHKPFKAETDRLPWADDNDQLERWKQGKTGFPLVDAAMRQLQQTAWMHNRLRMVCAMFLTKHLLIDWRLGERYFMQTLVDGDLASNNGGWQWSASTGVDAVPYFRIFNPTRQSERFDPHGRFIKRYVPELAELGEKTIHDPKAADRQRLNYPLAMVDHAETVARTKALFKGLNRADSPHQDLLDELQRQSA